MDIEVRGFILTLGYDILIFICCFLAWLYLRVLRGDPTTTSASSDANEVSTVENPSEATVSQSYVLSGETCGNTSNGLTDTASASLTPLLQAKSQHHNFNGGSETSEVIESTTSSNAATHVPSRTFWNWIYYCCDGIKHLFTRKSTQSCIALTNDACLYLEFLKTSTRFFLCLSVIGFTVVLPLNLSAPSHSPLQSFFDRAAAENVVSDSIGIWLLYVVCWLYCVIGYYFVFRFWSKVTTSSSSPPYSFNFRDLAARTAYTRRRNSNVEYLSETRSRPEDFTLMITGLPRECSFNPVSAVYGSHADHWPGGLNCDLAIEIRHHFEALHPGKVVTSQVILDYSSLLEAERELESTRKHLVRLAKERHDGGLLRHASCVDIRTVEYSPNFEEVRCDNSAENPSTLNLSAEASSFLDAADNEALEATIIEKSGACDDHSEDVFYWLQRYERQSSEMAAEMKSRPIKTAGVAFVSFATQQAVEECLSDPRVVGSHYDWSILPAPPPQDIIWENIHISSERRLIRKIVFNALLIIVSVLVVSPVTVVSSNLPSFAFDFERALSESSYLKLTLLSWLPPLILLAINNLFVPTLVWWVAVSTRYWRRSSQASYILNGNIIYLILYSLVIPLMSLQSLSALLRALYRTEVQKWSINLGFTLLSSSGSFAIRYLVNSCFITSSLQLLQLPQLSAKGIIKTGILGGKKKLRWVFDFGYWYAVSLSIFTLVLVFSVVVPLVLPCGAFFFAMMYWIDRYNFKNGIWSIDLDSGGEVASLACRYMLFSISFLQFCMAGFFLIQNDKYLTLAGTLLFITSTVSWVLLLCHSDSLLGTVPITTNSSHINSPIDGERQDVVNSSGDCQESFSNGSLIVENPTHAKHQGVP